MNRRVQRSGLRLKRSLLLLVLIFHELFRVMPVSAQHKYFKTQAADEIAQIPEKPSAPPILVRKKIPEYPHCARYFVYQGKQLECDSNLGMDAEGLRMIMGDVPAALAELDEYKNNRQKIKIASYLSTIGILTAIASTLVTRSTPAFDPNTGAPNLGGYLMIGGLGLTVNSFFFGLTLNNMNEEHIENAVKIYNLAHPQHQIELKFTTHLKF